MRSSYSDEDVILLLKDITGMVQPQPTEEREKLIQAGRHYSEMLPIEYVPTEIYAGIPGSVKKLCKTGSTGSWKTCGQDH